MRSEKNGKYENGPERPEESWPERPAFFASGAEEAQRQRRYNRKKCKKMNKKVPFFEKNRDKNDFL